MIQIELNYFGMVAELTKLSREKIELKKGDVIGLKQEIIKLYPSLEKIEFRVAIDHKMAEDSMEIKNNCEIALLPAFSGG